jgi:hypothetical protein
MAAAQTAPASHPSKEFAWWADEWLLLTRHSSPYPRPARRSNRGGDGARKFRLRTHQVLTDLLDVREHDVELRLTRVATHQDTDELFRKWPRIVGRPDDRGDRASQSRRALLRQRG